MACPLSSAQGLVQGGPARAMEEGNAGLATGTQTADPALPLPTRGVCECQGHRDQEGLSGCPPTHSLVPSLILPHTPPTHTAKEAPSQTTVPAPCALGLALYGQPTAKPSTSTGSPWVEDPAGLVAELHTYLRPPQCPPWLYWGATPGSGVGTRTMAPPAQRTMVAFPSGRRPE